MCLRGEKATAKVLAKNGRMIRVQVDRCMADLITHLNSAGIATDSSCCGHGDDSQFFVGVTSQSCFFGWRGDTKKADPWCGLVKRVSAQN